MVYSARHVLLNTRHAIKVFDVPLVANSALLQKKFLSEARILATLRHPNIVRVTDYGTAESGRPWLAMDYESGTTLAARFASAIPPSPDEISRLYADIRSALAYCHEKGIVHGDVKAENILVRADGSAVLADFGVARILKQDVRCRLGLTDTAGVGNFGTPYALAPECIDGDGPTAASDVYSFGVVMFKAITGIWYEGSARLLAQLGAFAPEWKTTVEKMLVADPSARYSSACELPAKPGSPTRIRRDPIKTQSRKYALFAAVAAVALAVYASVTSRRNSSHESATTPATPSILESCSEARLYPGEKVEVRSPVRIGILSLPDRDGFVCLSVAEDFEGEVLSADIVDGSLRNQVRIASQPGMRVIYKGDNSIAVRRQ